MNSADRAFIHSAPQFCLSAAHLHTAESSQLAPPAEPQLPLLLTNFKHKALIFLPLHPLFQKHLRRPSLWFADRLVGLHSLLLGGWLLVRADSRNHRKMPGGFREAAELSALSDWWWIIGFHVGVNAGARIRCVCVCKCLYFHQHLFCHMFVCGGC